MFVMEYLYMSLDSSHHHELTFKLFDGFVVAVHDTLCERALDRVEYLLRLNGLCGRGVAGKAGSQSGELRAACKQGHPGRYRYEATNIMIE